MTQADRDRLSGTWDFPWSVVDILVNGRSSIDLPALSVRDRRAALAFVRGYGYDLESTDSLRRVQSVLIEAWHFITNQLMPDEWASGKRPPQEVLDCDDVAQLMVWASKVDCPTPECAPWSCAVLRVMHTIAHIESLWGLFDFDEIRAQVHSRFDEYIFEQPDGRLAFGTTENSVKLDSLLWKEAKTRDSIVLKLLHKRANVAETVYDLMGVRMVTERLSDVVQVLKILHEESMIAFPNCHPGRARNTLIDVDQFRENTDHLRTLLTTGKVGADEFCEMLERMTPPYVPDRQGPSNPHTSQSYRSIQMTSRHLVHVENPFLGWLEKVKEVQAQLPPSSNETRQVLDSLLGFVSGWHSIAGRQQIALFFPFEIQLMDRVAYSENRSGDAAHDRYKSSQIRAARRRVLGSLLD